MGGIERERHREFGLESEQAEKIDTELIVIIKSQESEKSKDSVLRLTLPNPCNNSSFSKSE